MSRSHEATKSGNNFKQNQFVIFVTSWYTEKWNKNQDLELAMWLNTAMTTRFTTWLGLAVLLAVASAHGSSLERFGKGVTLTTATPLDQLLKQPAQFEGKTVRVEGVVTAVCSEMGCWMALGAKDAPGVPTVMIKVDDGVIVFPVSAKGRKAAAQGVVQRVQADDKEGNQAAKEKAAADKTVKAASADTWLIKATGALVYWYREIYILQLGMGIGIALGIVFGVVLKNIPLGLVLGVAFGAVFAGARRRRRNQKQP
jgi:hypothetical protein